MRRTELFSIAIGTFLATVGILVLMAPFDPTHPFYWVPVMLILIALISLATAFEPDEEKFKLNDRALIVASSLFFGAVLIWLRNIGVIDSPLLKYGLGGFILTVGFYGIYLGVAPWVKRMP